MPIHPACNEDALERRRYRSVFQRLIPRKPCQAMRYTAGTIKLFFRVIAMSSPDDASRDLEETPGLCDRCLKELVSGRGEFYEIGITAQVDSSPPILDSPESRTKQELDEEWSRTIRQLESISRVDAENQIHCRRRLLLCGPCFQIWIGQSCR